MLAWHYPTRVFTLAEVAVMPQCFEPKWSGMMAPNGYSLWKDRRGRLLVTFIEPDDWRAAYCVRPVIRVPAGIAESALSLPFRVGRV